MRSTLTLASLLWITGVSNAQLIHPSFETSGFGSIPGWTATCSPAVSLTLSAPGGGALCAAIPIGELGCPASYLYQTLPNINDGDVYTFSGWCTNMEGSNAPTWIGLFMGSKDANGAFSFGTGPIALSFDWTYLSFTDTFHLQQGDTAVVVCNGGYLTDNLGGSALFDGMNLSLVTTTGIDDSAVQLRARPNPATDKVWIDMVDAPVSITAMDAKGRMIPITSFVHQDRTLQVDLSSVPSGLVTLLIKDRSTVHALRMVKG